jgi:4-amino-4-deoxy-L-arabinose transferase-like glycosyltransferase
MRLLARKQVAVLLTLAGIVRLGAAAYWQVHWHGQFVFGDSYGYFSLARAIAHGEPYQLPGGEQVFRAPGYPLLLAPVLRFFDGTAAIWMARVESCLFGMLTVLAVAWWAGLLFGSRAAWIAGLITALYPEAIAISVPVLSEAPFCLLVAMNIAIWTLAWKRVGWHVPELAKGMGSLPPRPSQAQGRATLAISLVPPYAYALLAGALAAAATLVRPSWMLFLPFAIVCGLIAGPRRRQATFALAMIAGFVAVMLPWWVRNYRVTGHFVPTTLQVGASLYDGWNPEAGGGSDMRFVPEFEEALRQSDQANPAYVASDSFEYRLDRRFRAAAWNWARSNPRRVLQLAGVKFLRIWNVWPNEPAFSAWPVRLAVFVTYVPLMVLAFLGAWRARRIGWLGVLCWLPAVYFTLLHTVFVSSIRYRQPALMGLFVLAAGYLAESFPTSTRTAAIDPASPGRQPGSNTPGLTSGARLTSGGQPTSEARLPHHGGPPS